MWTSEGRCLAEAYTKRLESPGTFGELVQMKIPTQSMSIPVETGGRHALFVPEKTCFLISACPGVENLARDMPNTR